MKRRQSPEERMRYLSTSVRAWIKKWVSINEHGCHDPFWPDGTNMNLIRRHIIWAKAEMAELSLNCGCELPEEYYLETPPVVDDFFMADPNQSDRFFLRNFPERISTVKAEYNSAKVMLA